MFQSGKVGTGGYSVTFNDSIDIPAAILYESGVYIPLKLKDFIAFVQKNILDTSDRIYFGVFTPKYILSGKATAVGSCKRRGTRQSIFKRRGLKS